MQAAGYFITAFIELTTSMKYGHHYFQCGASFFSVNTGRNTAVIIFYRDRIVFMDGDCYGIAIPAEGFINGVVHHFVYQVMQALFADITDIHGRALTHSLKA